MARRREIEGDIVMGWPDRKRSTAAARQDPEGRVMFVQTPWWELQGLTTPVDLRYVVQHMGVPEPVPPEDWTFSVEGESIEHPLSVSLTDLQQMATRTVRAVTECSGNDSVFFDTIEPGGQAPSLYDLDNFAAGTISAGEFTGVPLRDVLERAGLNRRAVSVRVQGFDRGSPGPAPGARRIPDEMNYDKALPLEKALDPDTILAWGLNGEYLRHVHGAPVRLVVPGWAGNWWIKWVDSIEVLYESPWCFYQDEYYYYSESPEDPNREMITTVGVKAAITEPTDHDSPLPAGPRLIRGLAWSGEGEITGVEISTDGGSSWNQAELEPPLDRWMWARWSYQWNVKSAGRHQVMARATDAAGRIQPLKARWNHLKKNYDAVIPLELDFD